MTSTTPAPSQPTQTASKTTAVALAGALSTVVFTVLKEAADYVADPTMVAATTTIFAAVIAYIVPNRAK